MSSYISDHLDIDADKPGRSFDSFEQGRHAMSTEQEPIERIGTTICA